MNLKVKQAKQTEQVAKSIIINTCPTFSDYRFGYPLTEIRQVVHISKEQTNEQQQIRT